MPTFNYLIVTTQQTSKGSIIAASEAAADTLVRTMFTATYKTGTTAQTTVTPTVTSLTITPA